MTEVAVHPECPFSSESFDLLQQFKNNSKRDFYLAHEEKFKKYVEQPLQKLSRHVSAQLSGEITKQLEMDRDVLLNTIYQYFEYRYQKKLGSNSGDANLFINLTPEEFRFGLFISKTSPDKQRFIKNLQNNQIKEIILQNTHLPDKCALHYSSKRRLERFNRLSEWLKLVARQNSATKNIQISVHLKPNEVLLSSIEDLITHIKQTLEVIFPLFLLATHDKPLLVLRPYLNKSNIKSSQDYYSQGLKNYQEGNYQDAIKKFDSALEKASNLAEAYSYRGKAKAEMGDTEGAISDYSQLLLIQPKNHEAYQHRGNIYFKLKDYDAAIKDYNKALNIDPSFALAYYYRGCAHVELGNAQKAIEDLGKAAKLFDKEKDADNYEETQRILKTIQPDYAEPSFIEMYTICQCAEETGLQKTALEGWIRAINRKKQAILYGSPGTGKTFIAEKLAQHLIGGGNGFSELVQFHPAYSYEDFIQGIRPQSEHGKLTYPLVPGRFVQFCKEAENRQGICVLIIDEINRANLAQVFGELMYLLEYRDKEIPLAGGNRFRIPANVRIIGTMNTADRSIALVDYALRRRFAFIELRPNYDVLRRYHQKMGLVVEGLIQTLQRLNQTINDKNYEIGISFFLTDKLSEDIEDIWCMEIEPYLEEYFFNQPEKVDEFRWEKVTQQLSL